MTADDRLTRIRQKIERAARHISELESEIKAFLSRLPQPYRAEARRDPQTREVVYYAPVTVPETPLKISLVAGDVIQNLRSALDHLAYQLFMVGSRGGTTARHVYFPISESHEKYHREAPGKVKGMNQDAIKAINALKPYKDGNDVLWNLHRLSNIDKHRMLITAGAAHVAHSMTPGIRQALQHGLNRLGHPEILDQVRSISLDARQIKFPLKKGDELFRDFPNAEIDKNVEISVEVVFEEPDVLHTMVVPTLFRMAQSVDGIIVSFRSFLA
jgi:hypothetical protein